MENSITEEQTQYELELSELRYRRLFETAQDGILLIDFDTGMILDANKFLIDLLGYSKDDFLKKYLWEVGVFKDIAASKENFVALQTKGYVRFEDLPLETKDGKKIDVEFVANSYSVGKTTVIQCNIRDITLRKKAEEYMIQAQSVVENTHEAIIGETPDGVITSWNNGAEKIFGYSREEIIGKSVLILIPPERRGNMKDILDKIRSGESIMEQETTKIRKDGSLVHVSHSFSPIKTKDGKIVGVSAVEHDLTQRKSLEDELKQSEEMYKSMFENMLNGLAYCRMIYNDKDQPEDFIYLKTNSAFEKLTGLKDVVGKKITEIIPGIRQSDPVIFETYGRVALTGKSELFESYVKAMDMWFSISVYSPKKEYFVAIFDVITERKKKEESLKNKYEEIEQMNKFMVDREVKMADLKNEIDELKLKLQNKDKSSS